MGVARMKTGAAIALNGQERCWIVFPSANQPDATGRPATTFMYEQAMNGLCVIIVLFQTAWAVFLSFKMKFLAKNFIANLMHFFHQIGRISDQDLKVIWKRLNQFFEIFHRDSLVSGWRVVMTE